MACSSNLIFYRVAGANKATSDGHAGTFNERVVFDQGILNLNESFTSNWTSESVYGRADPIMTFQNTQREMSFTFTIINSSDSKAAQNIANLNKLVRMLYPTYEKPYSASTIKEAPLFRIKFSNFILRGFGDEVKESGLLCAITNLGIDIGEQVYSPSTSVYGSGEPITELVPEQIKISVSLTPLHEIPLGWNKSGVFGAGSPKHKFIATDAAAGFFDVVPGQELNSQQRALFEKKEKELLTDGNETKLVQKINYVFPSVTEEWIQERASQSLLTNKSKITE